MSEKYYFSPFLSIFENMKELLDFFSDKQLVSLFQNNLIIDAPLDMENRYSRNEGYFMVSKNKQANVF